MTPVLGLTRRGDLKTKLRAFDLGVDDILTMPFSPEELLARSIVITRRASGTDRPIVPDHHARRDGDRHPQPRGARRQLRRPPERHRAEPALPARQPRRAGGHPRGDPRRVWGTDFVAESNIVDRHVRSLRIKLQNDYRHPRFIATVPGKGYRFIPTFSQRGLERRATERVGRLQGAGRHRRRRSAPASSSRGRPDRAPDRARRDRGPVRGRATPRRCPTRRCSCSAASRSGSSRASRTSPSSRTSSCSCSCRRCCSAPRSRRRSATCARTCGRSPGCRSGSCSSRWSPSPPSRRPLVPGLGWAAAFALGAIVAPTDALAATTVFRRLGRAADRR